MMQAIDSVQDEQVKHYEELFGEKLTRWDSDARDKYNLGLMELYRHATGRERFERVLDVGCGSGHTIQVMRQEWGAAGYTGIDLSETAIQFAKRNLPEADWRVGSLTDLQTDQRFDLITVLGTLEHFSEPVGALEQLSGLLTDRGFIYLEVPNAIGYAFSEKVEGYRRLNGGSRQWEWHLYRSSWEKLIRDSQLQIAGALRGPKPWTEFIWLLTKTPETVDALLTARLRWYAWMGRLKASSTLNDTRNQIMIRVRRRIGDERVENVKRMLKR